MGNSQSDMLGMWRAMMRILHYFTNKATVNNTKANINVSFSQMRVIGVITDHYPQALMLKDIANELELTPGAVSQLVDTLCHSGLLERHPQENDRRSIAISLSAEGQSLIREADASISSELSAVLENFSKDKIAAFEEVLFYLQNYINLELNTKQQHGDK